MIRDDNNYINILEYKLAMQIITDIFKIYVNN